MSYKPAKNPHAAAAAGYDTGAKQSDDQRTLEARALLKSARQIQDLQTRWDDVQHTELDEILSSNRKLWMLFYDAALENAEGNRPNDLRSNIVNLSNFIFKRTIDVLANPAREKLDILITINREIAAGLSQKPAGMDNQPSQAAPAEVAAFAGTSA